MSSFIHASMLHVFSKVMRDEPVHVGGSPSQRPPSSVRQTLSALPSSLYPLTHEYVTLVGSERVTRLDTGCSGSPHAVESGTRERRGRGK